MLGSIISICLCELLLLAVTPLCGSFFDFCPVEDAEFECGEPELMEGFFEDTPDEEPVDSVMLRPGAGTILNLAGFSERS